MTRIKKNSAYSLIEIIVVISIILLFTGMGLASYGSFNDQRQVDAESKKLLSLLESARNKAMNSDLDVQSLSACDLKGYRLHINSTTKKYSLYIKCNTNDQTALVSETEVKSNVTIQTTPMTPIDVDFAVASGSSETCQNAGCSITLKNDKVDRCRVIEIKESGVIDEKDCP